MKITLEIQTTTSNAGTNHAAKVRANFLSLAQAGYDNSDVAFSYLTLEGKHTVRHGKITSLTNTHVTVWDYNRDEYRNSIIDRIVSDVSIKL